MADSEYVTLRSPEGEEVVKHRDAVPFFTNQGYVVLKADGSVNAKATSAASEKKES